MKRLHILICLGQCLGNFHIDWQIEGMNIAFSEQLDDKFIAVFVIFWRIFVIAVMLKFAFLSLYVNLY